MRHQLQMQYIDTVAKVGSIRKAADILAITSSALNRRILAMEEDLGVPVFDRVANGVRLNAAGELLIHHFRTQLAEMDRVKSQIHDLQGERRGHVAITCSQALMVSVIPNEISKYQREHPNVTFSVRVCTRDSAAQELRSFNADIALVFDPEQSNDFHTIARCPQSLLAQFHHQHELNQNGNVRLYDCLSAPLALPTKSNSIRLILERAAAKHSIELNVNFESNNFYLLRSMVKHNQLVSFTLPIGSQSSDDEILHRMIDERDIPPAMLHVGILKGRHLSVAAAKFADQVSQVIADN